MDLRSFAALTSALPARTQARPALCEVHPKITRQPRYSLRLDLVLAAIQFPRLQRISVMRSAGRLHLETPSASDGTKTPLADGILVFLEQARGPYQIDLAVHWRPARFMSPSVSSVDETVTKVFMGAAHTISFNSYLRVTY